MFRTFIVITAISIGAFTAHGQHHEGEAEAIPPLYHEPVPHDSLKRVLHDMGKFEGHIRTFFMNTINQGDNPDYYALAAGGGLAYYSPLIKNFQVGISGFIIYNLSSSHLGADNGYANRYELGLFDTEDPDNHEDLDRLENLYLRYYFNPHRGSFVQLGKFHISTPLMNLQDTRMRPNIQEGLWAEFKDWDKLKLRGGWLWSTTPRSTVEWYGIGESVGIYGNGTAVNGEPAEYEGHVDSKSVLIASAEWEPVKNVNYQYWNYHVDNLFNVALQKVEVKKHYTRKTWLAGLQYIWQTSKSDAGLPIENQYIGPDEESHVLSGRIAFTNNSNEDGWSLNYSRITSHGRFLFPREWGTETLYTYNNRERNEGAGDVHAVMLEHTRHLDKDRRVFFRGRGGVYKLPAVTNARLNKYSMPSYYQLTLQANYKFSGYFKGLEAQVLYTYKGNLDHEAEVERVVMHNKTQMHHFGVRMDYYF
ncbi:MAG: OprD family outer membrane porin [Chryseosolibacter sp.]